MSAKQNNATPDNVGRLGGRIALVTGGTSGIGAATARLFAREGAIVILTGRRVELGQAIVDEMNTGANRAFFFPADHTRLADCERVIAQVEQRFGRLNILFNNTGVVISGTAESTSEADWHLTMNLNITAVWRMSRLALPLIRAAGGGVIINNASDWGLVGGREAMAYCTSKGAVIQMTRAMALDHATENIRINAVCPGDTFVERWTQDGYYKGSGALDKATALDESGAAIPMGRVAHVDEIARAVLFLASSDASFITGSTLVVDGGNTAQ